MRAGQQFRITAMVIAASNSGENGLDPLVKMLVDQFDSPLSDPGAVAFLAERLDKFSDRIKGWNRIKSMIERVK